MEDFVYYGKLFLISVLPFQLIGFFVCLHRIRAKKHHADSWGIITVLMTFLIAALSITFIYANKPNTVEGHFITESMAVVILAIIFIPIGAIVNLFCAVFIPLLAKYAASFGAKKI